MRLTRAVVLPAYVVPEHGVVYEADAIGTGVGLIRCERLDRLALRRNERELRTLRFCCQVWCFAFIREVLQRYPIEHSRLSMPLPCDNWWHHPGHRTCCRPLRHCRPCVL